MPKDKFPVDNTKKSPGTNLNIFGTGKYWQDKLVNNDFLLLYCRHGIAHKVVDKFSSEMFKKSFLCDDKFQRLRDDFSLDSVARFAWVNAAISGFSLIYVSYPDVKGFNDYNTEAPSVDPDGFVVVPRAWVCEDVKQPGVNDDRDFYVLFQENGGTFRVHKSRLIRVSLNDNESSLYEPVFNAFSVADNILWSVGQTLWRVGQGFPVITLDNPGMVDDGSGGMISELDLLTKNGVLRDISSETGFIGDSRYHVDFKGAGGVVVRPMEYWDVCLQWIGISINIPKDILVGISAGAVTGSEVNLMEYYSMLKSKQVQELEPIYDSLFSLFGFVNVVYDWVPLFDQDSQELAVTLKTFSEAVSLLVSTGVLSSEMALNFLKDKDPVFEKIGVKGSSNISNNLDINFVKDQYKGFVDKDFDDVLKKSLVEGSALPVSVQNVEKRFLKDMGSQYGATSKVVQNIFEAFNTDSED